MRHGDAVPAPLVRGFAGAGNVYGYRELSYKLPGFNPLSGYFLSGPTSTQVPTLSSGPGEPFGIYYVNNSSKLVELQLPSGSLRGIAHVIPLYQLYGYGYPLNGMLDNEFFLEEGYDQALFFGTTTSSGSAYSIELANLTSGVVRMVNTSAPIDSFNQQPIYVGNNTVLVISSDCTIEAYNLASAQSWQAGTVGTNFGAGSTCVEANNIYWIPQKQQLINVEAHGDSADHVEQLNASYDTSGEIQFTLATTVAVDSGHVFNWVNGLAYNSSTDRIAFSAGYWVGSAVFTYVVPYSLRGLLTTSGEVRYVVYSGGPVSGQLIETQRYTFTSAYVLGQSYGPGTWANRTQLLFDPWNGSVVATNRSFDGSMCGNSCFEGEYAPSPDFVLDFNATVQLNNPMYRVVYAYHAIPTPTPTYGVTFREQGLPSGTRWTVAFANSTASSFGPSITFETSNGTPLYLVGPIRGYIASPRSGALHIAGANQGILITMSPAATATYAVEFEEIGLPVGTSWTVRMGSTTNSSGSAVIGFIEPNGSYVYAVGLVPDYVPGFSAGQVAVQGANQSVEVEFVLSAPTSVTFSAFGLPPSSPWAITLNGSSRGTTASTISFLVAPGTYSFTVGSVPGFTAHPSAGSVSPTPGESLVESIAFVAIPSRASPSTITFTDYGLPPGTPWSVSFNGTERNSTTTTVLFTAPSGTYGFSVAVVPGYAALPPSGTIGVDGQAIQQTIVFSSAPTSSDVPAPAGFLGLPGSTGYYLAGWSAAATAVSVLALWLALRRRPPAPTKLEESPPEGPPT